MSQSITDVADNISDIRDTMEMLVRTVRGQTERIVSLERAVRDLSERASSTAPPMHVSVRGPNFASGPMTAASASDGGSASAAAATAFDRKHTVQTVDTTSFHRGTGVPFGMDTSQFDGGSFREVAHPGRTDDTAETDVPPDFGGMPTLASGRFSSNEMSMLHRRSTAERLLSAELSLPGGDGLSILGSSAAAVSSSSNVEPLAKRARLNRTSSRTGVDFWAGNSGDLLGRFHSGPLAHTYSGKSAPPIDEMNERS